MSPSCKTHEKACGASPPVPGTCSVSDRCGSTADSHRPLSSSCLPSTPATPWRGTTTQRWAPRMQAIQQCRPSATERSGLGTKPASPNVSAVRDAAQRPSGIA
eukprot:CAMPEP_0180813452 /NCGR_PEP_ID=MMETSP1038_2-20121128/66544_1 /TAXON_ID=632150 /ORGANISM="Azadinium spinosum, Strain 3D9" /LENGTH=102 /DNA_ID=CAMNT_0022855047 /DNA_START=85 /DNA_END=390 /DNA_ORIENTATION=+